MHAGMSLSINLCFLTAINMLVVPTPCSVLVTVGLLLDANTCLLINP